MDADTMKKIKPGAQVRVWERIKEGEKERQSAFEGIVIARKHGSEAGASFTVRAVLSAVGVEKVYPIHSPMIAKVEILSSPKKVHRAKLYYLRGFSSRKVKERLKT
ncbi:50S ribosomal protein L19 [Candidatus Jorgensenbacteria bacterium CG10_big_fil_rev_8_21_14_0_10_54_38]|uniref:50S ribosomal protein L19 n=2 Tax=Candidatus Joergenseniibacteriota TaxID=1752739 RepID=A0A2M6WG55_9BACT|nr:MAG: 50S ribosomal protein L19 [Candidatus Jorgensenbacteria bacterium CG23_combo_of_CG06-09_8_20_14_all_54_14]PIT91793.1 MAG: 50S ribosomal protein L19 [Candidatus Jorgensenbacteria bacterium CG10_big_fil_rev_8_21_14_0_10_54_38]